MSLKKALDFVMSPLGTIVGGTPGKLIHAAGMIFLGVVTGNPGFILAGLAEGASALKKKPKVSRATLDRLNATLDPNAPRKIVLGRTAMATDVRYHAYTGTDQEYYEQILCVASHKVEAVEEIWFDTELAWTAAGGAQGRFAGYLTVAVKLEGTSANTVAIDARWGAAQRLTGCAYLHLKFKLTGNSKKAESPFSSSIPTRVTVRGKGALVPDPRLSTTAGGSGAQLMTDQSSWLYTTAATSGRNPACQVLFVLLGWKIASKLAVGVGQPSTRIDYASFITAANICDESVAKAGGGTETRYQSDGIFSEDDDPELVLSNLCAAMNAELTDENGKIAIRIDYDDLASPVLALNFEDVLDGDDWQQTDASNDANIVKGHYTDPSDGALYQLAEYPQVTLTGSDYGSPDGIQRIDPFDLPLVQNPNQAQRLAKLRLQRKQYPGTFKARFNMRAWGANYGRVVTLTHAALGFSAKKFRVTFQKLHADGSVDLVLREVATAQYSWSAEEVAVVTPAPPTAYNPLKDPLVVAVGEMSDSAVMVPTEKQNFIKQDKDAEDEYQALLARVTALGLTTPIQNMHIRSEEFDNAAWTKFNATVTANATAAPDGTLTADKIDLPSTTSLPYTVLQTTTPITITAASYVVSIYLKGDAGGETFWIYATPNGTTFVRQLVTLTRNWQRFQLVFTGTATTWYVGFGVQKDDAGQTAKPAQSFYAWGIQLHPGTAAFDYRAAAASAIAASTDSAAATMTSIRTAYRAKRDAVSGWDNPLTTSTVTDRNGLNSTFDFFTEKRRFIEKALGEVPDHIDGAEYMFPAFVAGVRNTNDVALTAADAGTTATISVPAHERRMPGKAGQLLKSYNSGSVPGLSFSTKYYVYCDDPTLAGGAVTYQATTNSDTLTSSAGRVAVGEITTPADGAGGTSGGGVGGGSFGGGGGGVYP